MLSAVSSVPMEAGISTNLNGGAAMKVFKSHLIAAFLALMCSQTAIATYVGNPVRSRSGGTQTDSSGSTGFAKITAGSWTYAAITNADLPFTWKQEVPGGTINNSNTAFTLASTPTANAAVHLYQDGLILVQGVDYTISGVNITMTTAPNFFQSLYASYVF